MRLRSLEQLMPFATAGEPVAHKRRSLVSVSPDTTGRAALREREESDIFAITLLKSAAVAVAISVYYLTDFTNHFASGRT